MAVTHQPPQRSGQPVEDGTPHEGASLLDVDPDLCAAIPADDHALARRVLAGPHYEIPKGRWTPELLRAHKGGFGLLVTDGAIIREVELAGRPCTQILGAGDVLQETQTLGVLECPVTWTAVMPSSLVVLDERFTIATRRWPSLGVNLQRRLLDQADRVALHAATAQLPHIERRVIALFWQLAERWGTVTPYGIEVELPLTHEALGRLVGAQRPTVSLAMRELADEGTLTGNARGGWVLHRDSREELRPGRRSHESAVRAGTH